MTYLKSSGDEPQSVVLTLERYMTWGSGPIWGWIDTVDGEQDVYIPWSIASSAWGMVTREDLDSVRGIMLNSRVVPNTDLEKAKDTPWVCCYLDASEEGGIYDPDS